MENYCERLWQMYTETKQRKLLKLYENRCLFRWERDYMDDDDD